MSESFAALFEESLKGLDVERGAVISGTVVAIDDDWVTVDTGLKSEGVIAREEFLNDRRELEVAVGDTVDVVVDALDNGMGLHPAVPREGQARRNLDSPRKDFRKRRNRQGHHLRQGQGRLHRRRRFHPRLPAGFAGRHPSDPRHHAPRRQVNSSSRSSSWMPKRNNVVVSRRAVMEAESSAEREALLENLQEGQSVKGIIKNLTDYGAFVDLGGIDGLLHITDMAWKRVKHPSEIVEVGQEMDRQGAQVRPRAQSCVPGPEATGRRSVAGIMGRYPEGTASRPSHQPDRLRLLR
jgi:small subunit ribosomal protein S1